MEQSIFVSVDCNIKYQIIDGFGCSQAEHAKAVYAMNAEIREELMDLLFTDKGIALNILRNDIFPEYNPERGKYNFEARPDQTYVMKSAASRGVSKIIASVWSPPAWMKTNNRTTRGGRLKKECYNDFAKEVAEFIRYFVDEHSINIYGISVCNEPNTRNFIPWNSCEWNGREMVSFYKESLIPIFKKYNLEFVKLLASEYSWWSSGYTHIPFLETGDTIIKKLLMDGVTREKLDIVASHSYELPFLNPKIKPFKYAKKYNKPVWMTEVSSAERYDKGDCGMTSALHYARLIHEHITKAGVSGWLYWLGVVGIKSDEGLIWANSADNTYIITKRFYAIGQYSKFIKSGDIRVEAICNNDKEVAVSAYVSPESQKKTVIFVNSSLNQRDIELKLDDAKQAEVYITDEKRDLQKCDILSRCDGGFRFTMPSESVVTLVAY